MRQPSRSPVDRTNFRSWSQRSFSAWDDRFVLDVCPYLGPERSALLDLLASLSAEGWRQATECAAWDVKGIALHVLGDDLSLLARQRDQAENGLVLYAMDHPGLTFRQLLDGFNEQWVTAAGFFSERIVIDLLELSGRWTEDFYRSVDPEGPGEPVGFFGSPAEPSPWWQVAAREYAERWIHQSQIRRALGLSPLRAELAEPAMEAVVLGIGARNTVLGCFTVGEQAWEFRDGPTVALEPDKAVQVLSRGLTLDETVAAMAGDEQLLESVAEQTCRSDGFSDRSRET